MNPITSTQSAINLVPPARQTARLRAKRVRLWTGVLGALLPLSGLAVGAMLAMQTSDDRAESIARLEGRIAQVNLSVSDRAGEARALAQQMEFARALGDRPAWHLLLGVIADSLTEEAGLRRMWLTQTERGRVLELDGTGATQAEVSRFVLALENTGLFKSAELVEARRDSREGADRGVVFKVRAELIGEKR